LSTRRGAAVAHADPEGRPGYILTGAAFDGVMTAAELPVRQNTVDGQVPPVHVRETRDGAIIPILNSAPTFADNNTLNGGHDLRVAWYRPDERNGRLAAQGRRLPLSLAGQPAADRHCQ
jgi:hypothetical protein